MSKAKQDISRVLATVKDFDPVVFMGEGWKILEGECDKRAEALVKVDFTKVNLENCLKEGESYISGEENLKRLGEKGNILLGVETFLALWNEPGHETLKWIYNEKLFVSYLNFFGTVIKSPHGNRYVLCLYRDDRRWHWSCSWLGNDWCDRDFSVSLVS